MQNQFHICKLNYYIMMMLFKYNIIRFLRKIEIEILSKESYI